MKRKKNPTPHTADHTAVNNESFTLALREDGQLQWVPDNNIVIKDYGTLSFDIQEAKLPDELITPRAGKGLKKPSTEI